MLIFLEIICCEWLRAVAFCLCGSQWSISPSRIFAYITFLVVLFQNIKNEWAKAVLSDAENLTEERVDEVLNQFLKDFKEGLLEAKSWPSNVSAYTVSKAALNAYTRILARKCPTLCINCLSWLCQNRSKLQQWHLNYRRRCWKPCEIGSAAWWGAFRPILRSEGSVWILTEKDSLLHMN